MGTVNTVVAGSPTGCSRIADNVRAVVGSTQSSNFAKIVVPPQVMIKMVVGEAGGQPDDIDQQAILVVSTKQIWRWDVSGELGNASGVFTGQVTDIVAGSKCYWSPTNTQWHIVQSTLQSGTTTFPAGTGAPAWWTTNKRQIVYKASIGLNVSGGSQYANAPAFVFVRQRQSNQAAAIQIP